ncbi:MAG: cytochrome c [Acidobacteria bacterium]|nr:cytochrome c [Acidobacteriota bacterium]
MKARRLGRWNGTVAVAALALLVAGAAWSGTAAQERTVWDGVYTEEQATRGMATYEQECSQCHLEDLLGDGIAPALIGAPFHFRWSDLSVGDMLVAIRTTMPQGAPASLSPRAYADIVAYMLKVNDFPAGDTELPTGVDDLEGIIIVEDAP